MVQNAFGILAARFRCLLGKLQQDPQDGSNKCILNNILRTHAVYHESDSLSDRDPETHEFMHGGWRRDPHLHDLSQPKSFWHAAATRAKAVREYQKHYVNGQEGKVPS